MNPAVLRLPSPLRGQLRRLCWAMAGSFVLLGGELRAEEAPPEPVLAPLPGRAPDPPENPSTPQKVALGRALFFDPILSGNGTVACATCHHPAFGWGDGRATPIGIGGAGLGPERHLAAASANTMAPLTRNVPSLLNVGFNGLTAEGKLDPHAAPMFWDGRVQGLEAQALAPLRSREEMRGDSCTEDQAIPQALERLRGITEYRRLFAEAFPQSTPQEPVNAEHLTQALAAFERTLVTGKSPFDRFLGGDHKALSPQALTGLEVFKRAGCALCHNGPMLSDYKLHVVGVIDPGGAGPREFRTPTLRNLKHTGPYMHNGSLRSLEQVMAFYEQLSDEASETLGSSGETPEGARLDPLFRKLNLQQDDFPALQAFLDSLSVESYETSLPEHVPSGLPAAGMRWLPYSSPSK